MRVAVYNQMFGLNGKNLFSFLAGHWAVHYQKNPEKIWRRANLSKTIEVIRKSKADITGIIEVLEGQEKELRDSLKKIGYNYFYIGIGHKTKYSDLYVKELIASKIKGEQIKSAEWPVENRLGGGGGFAHVFYSNPNFHLIFVHLGLPSKKYYWKQINFLINYLRKLHGKIILLGDFNLPYKDLKSDFLDYELVSGEIKTCSTTPVIKWFYNKDVDHILVKGFKKIDIGSLDGYSDHKLIWADLK